LLINAKFTIATSFGFLQVARRRPLGAVNPTIGIKVLQVSTEGQAITKGGTTSNVFPIG